MDLRVVVASLRQCRILAQMRSADRIEQCLSLEDKRKNICSHRVFRILTDRRHGQCAGHGLHRSHQASIYVGSTDAWASRQRHPRWPSAISRSERCRRREKPAFCVAPGLDLAWCAWTSRSQATFLRQDHLVMALSGENAGLAMTLKKTTAPCRLSRCPPLCTASFPL